MSKSPTHKILQNIPPEEKIKEIEKKLSELREKRKKFESSETQPHKKAEPVDYSKPIKKYFHHPHLEYIYGEVVNSPYMTKPLDPYPEATLKLAGELYDKKVLGIKFSDIPPDQRPYDLKKVRNKFIREIVNYQPRLGHRPTEPKKPETRRTLSPIGTPSSFFDHNFKSSQDDDSLDTAPGFKAVHSTAPVPAAGELMDSSPNKSLLGNANVHVAGPPAKYRKQIQEEKRKMKQHPHPQQQQQQQQQQRGSSSAGHSGSTSTNEDDTKKRNNNNNNNGSSSNSAGGSSTAAFVTSTGADSPQNEESKSSNQTAAAMVKSQSMTEASNNNKNNNGAKSRLTSQSVANIHKQTPSPTRKPNTSPSQSSRSTRPVGGSGTSSDSANSARNANTTHHNNNNNAGKGRNPSPNQSSHQPSAVATAAAATAANGAKLVASKPAPTVRPTQTATGAAVPSAAKQTAPKKPANDGKSSFVERQEAESRRRKEEMEYKKEKANYDCLLDKKCCPTCGVKQSFDEVRQNRQKCPGCNVDYVKGLTVPSSNNNNSNNNRSNSKGSSKSSNKGSSSSGNSNIASNGVRSVTTVASVRESDDKNNSNNADGSTPPTQKQQPAEQPAGTLDDAITSLLTAPVPPTLAEVDEKKKQQTDSVKSISEGVQKVSSTEDTSKDGVTEPQTEQPRAEIVDPKDSQQDNQKVANETNNNEEEQEYGEDNEYGEDDFEETSPRKPTSAAPVPTTTPQEIPSPAIVPVNNSSSGSNSKEKEQENEEDDPYADDNYNDDFEQSRPATVAEPTIKTELFSSNINSNYNFNNSVGDVVASDSLVSDAQNDAKLYEKYIYDEEDGDADIFLDAGSSSVDNVSVDTAQLMNDLVAKDAEAEHEQEQEQSVNSGSGDKNYNNNGIADVTKDSVEVTVNRNNNDDDANDDNDKAIEQQHEEDDYGDEDFEL